MPNNLDSIHISALSSIDLADLESVTGGWEWPWTQKPKDCWTTGFDNSVSTDWATRSREGNAECALQDKRAETRAIALGQQRKK